MRVSDGPLRLRGAQRDIRDAYFTHEAGLFALDCVPGSGKSVVAHHLAAEELLRRYAAGDRTPEQRVGVVSFNRDEAAGIVPAVCDRLREIVEHGLVPAADEVTDAELEYLVQRVRRAPFVGTIDSLLRDVFGDVAADLEFEEEPAVGNAARLRRVHADCYDAVREDPELAARCERLAAAYPDGEYEDGVADVLERAVEYCRDRRLSTQEFRKELEATFDAVYAEGRPSSFADVAAAVERCVGSEAASDRLADALEDADREHVVDADRELHDAWADRIDDLCALLAAYRAAYRERTREAGVVSHTDVAYLVAAYFDGDVDDTDDAHRERVRDRYRSRLESLVVDEAQDVSAVQHAALASLVTPATRVFACGDVLQSIYRWRHADPTLFERAVDGGPYLGVDWDVHESRTATTTYRCAPDVAAAVDAVAEPALTDPDRGDLDELDVDYPGLEAAREPTGETGVHVAAFEPNSGDPGSYRWVDPVEGRGEADVLATYVANGLADGTFTDGDGDPLGVTVLFRRTTRMDAYEAAFETAGLDVWNASENLFDCPVVGAVLDVCEWLVEPADPDRLAALVAESELGLDHLAESFAARGWNLDAVLADLDEDAPGRETLAALREARADRDAFAVQSVAAAVEEVVDALALRADSQDLFPGVEPAQRVANLDALVETVREWEGEDSLDLREFVELVGPFRANPREGPAQPSTADADHDVAFRTVHRAKGDEDDVVVVADPGFDVWSQGPHAQRFVAQGDRAGLAPPANTGDAADVDLPPFAGGLYDPENARARDVGLRWASARWRDEVLEETADSGLVGPDRLRAVAGNERAEAWRLLYVAVTRARDHLVVPLPRSVPDGGRPRDRWLDALRDGLGFTGEQTGTYTLEVGPGADARTVDVGVNDVELLAASHARASPPDPDVAVSPPRRDELGEWVPRFVAPSTMYPLTESPGEFALAHLLGDPMHTATNDVPDDLGLPFDRLGPHDVGTCLHDVLTALVDRDLPEAALRAADDEVRTVFDETVRERAPRAGDDEREALFAFFTDRVLGAFLESDLWERIRTAETVAVEKPVDGLVRVGNLEVELHGEADFVVEPPSGERSVADAKIALAEPTRETRRRYELQTAAYAYLFEQQDDGGAPPHRSVETFGVVRDTVTSSAPPVLVERRLRALIGD